MKSLINRHPIKQADLTKLNLFRDNEAEWHEKAASLQRRRWYAIEHHQQVDNRRSGSKSFVSEFVNF